jgi:hypothetical protein
VRVRRRALVGVVAAIAVVAGGGGVGALAAGSTTTASIYQAFNANGTVKFRTQTKVGTCSSGSIAINRRDAWRCGFGNDLADPCFSSAAAKGIVACPDGGPWAKDGVEIKLTKALPTGAFANHAAASLHDQPWAIETTSGALCELATGASNELDGQRANYYCVNRAQEVLWGFPDRGVSPWTIFSAPDQAKKLTVRAAIKRAWM